MAIWKRVRFVLLVVAALLVVAVAALLRDDDPPEDTGFAQKTLTGVEQALIVQGANSGGSKVSVALYERSGAGDWHRIRGPYSARIGENGFRLAADRSEGDGSTPRGVFPLPSAFGAEAAPGGTTFPYVVVTPGQCWISDPNDAAYNRWVNRSPCDPPNVDLWARSRVEQKFHTAIVIGFNTEYRRQGAGSALFVHLPELDGSGRAQGTGGGVGLPEDQIRSIIKALDPAANPVVIMGSKDWISSTAMS